MAPAVFFTRQLTRIVALAFCVFAGTGALAFDRRLREELATVQAANVSTGYDLASRRVRVVPRRRANRIIARTPGDSFGPQPR